jgi:hypothetical protein
MATQPTGSSYILRKELVRSERHLTRIHPRPQSRPLISSFMDLLPHKAMVVDLLCNMSSTRTPMKKGARDHDISMGNDLNEQTCTCTWNRRLGLIANSNINEAWRGEGNQRLGLSTRQYSTCWCLTFCQLWCWVGVAPWMCLDNTPISQYQKLYLSLILRIVF